MASDQKPYDWRETLNQIGPSDPERVGLEAYAEALTSRNLPVIFGLDDLALVLGTESRLLQHIFHARQKFYRAFDIPKRRGGSRTISAPFPTLLQFQRWINTEIFSKLGMHESAYGFVHGKSIIMNAKQHLGCETLLKIDLKDFFPSIGLRRVLRIFRWLGYTPTVSFYLASLCTLDDCLPQGAATSPALSNLIARRLDLRLSAAAKIASLSYTRYADDLTFSGNHVSASTMHLVKSIVESEGFSINNEKTLLANGQKKIVTGISVSGDRLKLPRSTRRALRQEFHFVRKRGVLSHMAATQQHNPLYVESLLGKFAFWASVEPENDFAAEGITFLRGVQKALDSGNL